MAGRACILASLTLLFGACSSPLFFGAGTSSLKDVTSYPMVNVWIKGNAVAGVPSFRIAQSMVNVGQLYVPGEEIAAYTSVMFGGEGPGIEPGSDLFHNDTWLLSRREGEQPWWSPCVSATSKTVPPGRILHTMVSLSNGSVLLFGGFGYPPTLETWWPSMSDLWILQPGSCVWRQIVPAAEDPWPMARAGHTAVMYNTSMVVFGGCGALVRGHNRPLCHNSTFQYNDVWVFDIETLTWRLQNTTGDTTPKPRYNHLAVALGDQLFVTVGQDDNWSDRHKNPPHFQDNDALEQDDDDDAPQQVVKLYHLREVWSLNLTSWIWTRMPDGPSDEHGSSITLSGKGTITAYRDDEGAPRRECVCICVCVYMHMRERITSPVSDVCFLPTCTTTYLD